MFFFTFLCIRPIHAHSLTHKHTHSLSFSRPLTQASRLMKGHACFFHMFFLNPVNQESSKKFLMINNTRLAMVSSGLGSVPGKITFSYLSPSPSFSLPLSISLPLSLSFSLPFSHFLLLSLHPALYGIAFSTVSLIFKPNLLRTSSCHEL